MCNLEKGKEKCPLDNEELRQIYIDFLIKKLSGQSKNISPFSGGFLGFEYDTTKFQTGDVVYIDSNKMLQFAAPYPSQFGIGMVVRPGEIAYSGEINGINGMSLTSGQRYWLSTNQYLGNTLTNIEPLCSGDYPQYIGFARDCDTFILSIDHTPRQIQTITFPPIQLS